MTHRSDILFRLMVVAQVFDWATVDPARELNPIGVHELALPLKVVLVAFLFLCRLWVGRRFDVIVLFALAMGALGTWSNLR